MPIEHTYVLIAGCRDDEESKEYSPPEGGGPHGALTYFLCQQLRQATPGTTYRDVFETVAARVNAYNKVQHPQMEGQADREVFGVADLAPVSFVPIAERAGPSAAVLGAGAAQGLTVGSTYGVWPPGTKTPATGTSVADIEITAVRPFAADARITREDPAGAVVPGARAFESAHAFGDARLTVEVVAPAGAEAERLGQALHQSGRLRVVTASTEAAARIYLLPRRIEASPSMPVPQSGALAAPKWAVGSATGDLLMKLKDVGDESTVVQNLEKIARYRQVLAIENPDPRSRLRGKVSLELFRRGSNEVAAPETNGGLVVCSEGEKVTLRITNRHRRRRASRWWSSSSMVPSTWWSSIRVARKSCGRTRGSRSRATSRFPTDIRSSTWLTTCAAPRASRYSSFSSPNRKWISADWRSRACGRPHLRWPSCCRTPWPVRPSARSGPSRWPPTTGPPSRAPSCCDARRRP
jgi:hypothetical protein